MKFRFLPVLIFLSLALTSTLAFSGVEQISEAEFKQLAEELAPKVNLFAEGWATDPKAEFYGGTTRDYLYWLKGQFRETDSREAAEKAMAELRALPVIDVREFIIGDSDVDVISNNKEAKLRAEEFGVRKIDFQNTDILNPATEMGQNERLQGYIPAEKIRLAREGFHPSGLGDGVKEIYSGKLTVHFSSPDDFAKSKYAQEGVNHPILLALRYIRLQAINYFRTHGQGYPDPQKLMAGMDEESRKAVQAVIDDVSRDPVLKPFLQKEKFRSWLNGSIEKSFRSYTNPTAAKELMLKFGVERLPVMYGDKVNPIFQYVFAKHRDPEVVAANIAHSHKDPNKLFTQVKDFFPNGRLYHGPGTEEAFRSILLQGTLPSKEGRGGKGLYGVAETNKAFSEEWKGTGDRLLYFPVDENAKIIDITQGEGEDLWKKFPESPDKIEKFAETYGADIIRYPYKTEAFVVKNAGVLGPARGEYRNIKTVMELIEDAKNLHTVEDVLKLISLSQLSSPERNLVWKNSNVTVEAVVNYLEGLTDEGMADKVLDSPHWLERPEIQRMWKSWLNDSHSERRMRTARQVYNWAKNPPENFVKFVDDLFSDHEFMSGYKWDRAFSFLVDSGRPMPNAVEFGVQKVERAPYIHTEFLKGAPLSDSQLDRFEVLLDRPAVQQSFLSLQLVSEILVSRGRFPEKLKTLIESNFSDPVMASYFAKLIAENIPEHPFTRQAALKLAETYFEHEFENHLKPNLKLDTFSIIAAKLPDHADLKNFYVKFLDHKNTIVQSGALEALQKMNLDAPVYVSILESKNPNYGAELMKYGAQPPPRGSKEVVKAMIANLLHPYFPTPDQKEAIQRIADYGLWEEQEKILEEAIRTGKIPGSDRGFDRKSWTQIFDLISANGPNMTPEQRVASLSLVELAIKHPNSISGPNGDYLLRLPLENKEVAFRVQNILWRNGDKVIDHDFLQIAERMPDFQERFRGTLSTRGALAVRASGRTASEIPFKLLAKRGPCEAGYGSFQAGGNP